MKDGPANGLPLSEVVKRAESPCVIMVPDGIQRTPLEEKGTIMGFASLAPTSNPSPAAVEFVEVEVDTETGEVKVLRVVYAHDIGKVINPSGAEGQVEGGLQQGLGYALMENLVFDHSSGACLSADFLNYKMPTAMEMPAEITCHWVESNEPTGPIRRQVSRGALCDCSRSGHCQCHLQRHRGPGAGFADYTGKDFGRPREALVRFQL